MASEANFTLIGRGLLFGYAGGRTPKYHAVLDYLCGVGSYREVAERAGVQPSTVHGWVAEFRHLCKVFLEEQDLSPWDLIRAVDDDSPGYVRPDAPAEIRADEHATTPAVAA